MGSKSLKHERASKKLVLTYRRDLIISCRDQLGSDLFFSFVNWSKSGSEVRDEALRWNYYILKGNDCLPKTNTQKNYAALFDRQTITADDGVVSLTELFPLIDIISQAIRSLTRFFFFFSRKRKIIVKTIRKGRMYYFFVFANSLKHERASKKLVLTYRRDLISSYRDQLGSNLFFSFVN